ncbi:hypothetical protein X943_002584 [Babesia divergens]|uniref:Uncharacterized protein n=1 Tax=Babesia divergens TaxID=32595 RepID=A0AAD9LF58_BABDI|nr:hypothetical protein X943_002584 [Babesia divergens]
MDKFASSVLSGSRALNAGISRAAGRTVALGRRFSSGTDDIVINNEYVLKPVPGDSGKYYFAFTKEKMASLKELSFIDFTKQKRIEKNEFLLSVESAKTMFDFMSPATLEIISLNKKFAEQPSEDTLKELKEKPDLEDNYLMIVKLE